MFYEDEDNNCGSKEMTVNFIDKLTTSKILKASGFIQSQAKALPCHAIRHYSRFSLYNSSKRKIAES